MTMTDTLVTWDCPKGCEHVEHQPTSASQVWHKCRKQRANAPRVKMVRRDS